MDLARPPGGEHPATQQASQDILTRSGRSTEKRAHESPNDSE
jgi:hypothetical protein